MQYIYMLESGFRGAEPMENQWDIVDTNTHRHLTLCYIQFQGIRLHFLQNDAKNKTR